LVGGLSAGAAGQLSTFVALIPNGIPAESVIQHITAGYRRPRVTRA
jgi:hypothetical protein